MFEAKEKFLDRIEQSFVILKNTFSDLVLPYVFFSIIFLAVFPALGFYLFQLSFPIENLNLSGNPLTDINFGLALTYGITLGLIYILLYLFAFMLVQIGTIVGVRNTLRNQTIDPKENIVGYALRNIGNIFRTYWYIFAYVALIPALIFIVGGCLFIAYMFVGSYQILQSLGVFLMGISVVIFIVFSVYRGIRSSFALSFAVEKDSFTKENFKYALQIVDGNWWRVLWNFLAVGIIGGLITSLVGNITNALGLIGNDYTNVLSSMNGEGVGQLNELLTSFGDFSIISFVSVVLNTIVGAILAVFMIAFSYIFMLRLEKERFGSETLTSLKETNLSQKNTEDL